MEIERKYLVDEDQLKTVLPKEGLFIKQGYFVSNEKFAVRVRTKGSKGYLTIKGAGNGLSREEFEYQIPLEEAEQMLESYTQPYLSKIRYEINYHGHVWEVDVFKGALEGLILAEIELSHEEELFKTPPFVKEEVTFNADYLNSNIIKRLLTV